MAKVQKGKGKMATTNLNMEFLKNGIEWNICHDALFCCEIETKKVSGFLPKGIIPVELRPGVATFTISGLPFPAGNLDRLPKFNAA